MKLLGFNGIAVQDFCFFVYVCFSHLLPLVMCFSSVPTPPMIFK